MHKIFIILITLIQFYCNTKQDDNKFIYYVIKNVNRNPKLPSPPSIYYGNHNFILIDTSKIFYHNKYVYYYCGTGVDFNKPPRLFLAPKSLTEIKIKDLQAFLSNNIPDNMFRGCYVSSSISSPGDTIQNRGFKIIVDYFKIKKIGRYVIRNWTEEEQFVVTAKIKNIPYDPSKVEWKVGFDIKFIPPRETIPE